MPSWSAGVYPASICATLQDVFFIILDVGGSVNALPFTTGTSNYVPSGGFSSWMSSHVYLQHNLPAASRCVWRAMHPDTLSALYRPKEN